MSDGREGGFIKAHRQWESSPAVEALSAEGEVVWLRLLFAANWKDSTVILREGPRTIRRGQALIAERTLAARARVGRQVVRTALETLTVAGCIQTEKVNPRGNPRASLITIVNYDKFQAFDDEPTHDLTTAQPEPNPSPTRSEEGEEEKKKLSAANAAPPCLFLMAPATEAAETGHPSSASVASQPDPVFDRVAAVWNRHCAPVGFATARDTVAQRKAVRTRIRERGWFEAFETACAYMAREPFYRGGADGTGWVATFGWLLKPGNSEKTADRAATRPAGPLKTATSPVLE